MAAGCQPASQQIQGQAEESQALKVKWGGLAGQGRLAEELTGHMLSSQLDAITYRSASADTGEITPVWQSAYHSHRGSSAS